MREDRDAGQTAEENASNCGGQYFKRFQPLEVQKPGIKLRFLKIRVAHSDGNRWATVAAWHRGRQTVTVTADGVSAPQVLEKFRDQSRTEFDSNCSRTERLSSTGTRVINFLSLTGLNPTME